MPVVKLGTSGADDQERHAVRPVGQMLEEGEQRVVRPVDVLEDEDRGSLLCDRLKEAPPGCEGFLLLHGSGLDPE